MNVLVLLEIMNILLFMQLYKTILSLAFLIISTSCFNYGELNKIAHLSKALSESSGIEQFKNDTSLWMINDSGNSNNLFKLSTQGKIQEIIEIIGVKNEDWEDLTSDDESRLFIGEFGNNKNDRKDLAIYIVNTSAIIDSKVKPDIIEFYLEDQKDFPPKKSKRNFDIEAFFYANNHLYLLSKNRSSKFNGKTKLYKLVAKPGKQKAKLIGSYITCTNNNHCMVTGADLSPDGKQLAILTHDSVFLVTEFDSDFLNGSITRKKLGHNSQKEAICFNQDGTELYITDERHKGEGGNLYIWAP